MNTATHREKLNSYANLLQSCEQNSKRTWSAFSTCCDAQIARSRVAVSSRRKKDNGRRANPMRNPSVQRHLRACLYYIPQFIKITPGTRILFFYAPTCHYGKVGYEETMRERLKKLERTMDETRRRSWVDRAHHLHNGKCGRCHCPVIIVMSKAVGKCHDAYLA